MLESKDPKVAVIARSRNEMPHVNSVLDRLLHQRGCVPRIAFLDGDVDHAGVRIVEIDADISTQADAMHLTTDYVRGFACVR